MSAGVLRRIVARKDDVVPVAGLIGVIADVTVPDEEIDSFVADFKARFVPEKTGEADAGPATTQVQIADGLYAISRPARAKRRPSLIHGFGGDLKSWALQSGGAGGVNSPSMPWTFAVTAAPRSRLEAELWMSLPRTCVGSSILWACKRCIWSGTPWAEPSLFSSRVPIRTRVSSLVLIASAGLGPEIDIEYINGFISAQRRKDLTPQIEKLFADRKLVTRQLIEDVLRFKRLDGVESSLRAIASQFFPEGRQAWVLREQMNALAMPTRVIWGAEDRILPVSHARDLPENITVEVVPAAATWCRWKLPRK